MIKRMASSYLLLVSVISLLTACGTANESIKIDDNFAKNLYIEEVDSSEQASGTEISDVSKVREILSMVDGLKVKEADENASEILKSNQRNTSYIFSFFTEKMETGKEVPYTFIALEDGTFIFTHDKVNAVRKKPLVTVEKHKDLLNEIKNKSEVEFLKFAFQI